MVRQHLGAHGDERNGEPEATLASARPQAGYPAEIFPSRGKTALLHWAGPPRCRP